MPEMNVTNAATTVASIELGVPARPLKVTYFFDTSATKEKALGIPYAVAIDGDVLSEFHAKPKRVGKAGTIEVSVVTGNKVELYLNSDAHPSYREQPVYAVTVANHDVKVRIKERLGKDATPDTPEPCSTSKEQGVDTYDAPLTGDIWMKVSHRYEASEVDAHVLADVRAEVKEAVREIYKGLVKEPNKPLTLKIGVAGKDAATLLVTFNDADNPKNNITTGHYHLRHEGLPRVHPAGYAAIFEAALAVGAPTLTMSSCWRPCLGSIAHRAGLGLDVSMVGTVTLNREELTHADSDDHGYVTTEEKDLYEAFERARSKEKSAITDERTKQRALRHARADARAALKKATVAREDAESRWRVERDKNEPEILKKFRAVLADSRVAAQIFDPWRMESQHGGELGDNRQENQNEIIHANHLHLTVPESQIL